MIQVYIGQATVDEKEGILFVNSVIILYQKGLPVGPETVRPIKSIFYQSSTAFYCGTVQ